MSWFHPLAPRASRRGLRRRPALERLETRCLLDATFGQIQTTQHIDLGFDYLPAQGGWHLSSQTGGSLPLNPAIDYKPSATLHYVAPQALVPRPGGSQWDFLGVTAGTPLWILPQNQNLNLLYLGTAALETTPGTFAS